MSWNNYNKQFILDRITIASTGCWEWNMQIDAKGYGRVAKGAGDVLVHRLSYRLFKGEILPMLNVLHECDNPACCNPEHLFLGTQAENVADAVSKGRKGPVPQGWNESRKISQEKRLEVLKLTAEGYKTGEVVTKLNISRTAVKLIKSQGI